MWQKCRYVCVCVCVINENAKKMRDQWKSTFFNDLFHVINKIGNIKPEKYTMAIVFPSISFVNSIHCLASVHNEMRISLQFRFEFSTLSLCLTFVIECSCHSLFIEHFIGFYTVQSTKSIFGAWKHFYILTSMEV